MPVSRAGYLQELAVRVLLHSLAVAAARYGRTIQPILSVGMDFYVRVFVEVRDDKAGVNRLSLQVGQVYQSTQCPTFYCVPAGQLGGKKGNVYQPGRLPVEIADSNNPTIQNSTGGGPWKIAGPLWLGPMHDRDVLAVALQRLEAAPGTAVPDTQYLATRDRLRGLLTSCRDELPDCPLFYKLPDLCQCLRLSRQPALADIRSALANAGYRVSGYHKDPVAIKTNAPPAAVWDVLRAWARLHPPVKPPLEGSVGARLLANADNISEDSTHTGTTTTPKIDFTPHPDVLKQARAVAGSGVKRFPMNPQANWGPKPRATGHKRKAPALLRKRMKQQQPNKTRAASRKRSRWLMVRRWSIVLYSIRISPYGSTTCVRVKRKREELEVRSGCVFRF